MVEAIIPDEEGRFLRLLDQRALPWEETYLTCRNAADVAEAIRRMAVRGAPAIGIAAAYGLALEMRRHERAPLQDKRRAFAEAYQALEQSRPTAVNLFWALRRLAQVWGEQGEGERPEAEEALWREARLIHEEDRRQNLAIGRFGAEALGPLLGDKGKATLYTHCNTGSLATGGYGTAFSILRHLWQEGHLSHVYAGETRPRFQGGRLTAWELQKEGIPFTVVVDSAAASLMAQGKIQAVVVGADRIARNGDVANKIGTYSLAVLAQAHGIPFVVAAPSTTFDGEASDGKVIPIEERNPEEVLGREPCRYLAPGVPVWNPAFDVTPASFISLWINEKGSVAPPFSF
ncbi:MAG: S-methyl-5-thioribose-1-phosphate isomerase [Bacillota bacterium]|nr:S-methyl-5-thioribose-1-phosphate isomerase [Bacillota bacterium]